MMERYDLMRHFMCDDISLSLYINGKQPTFKDIEESLIVRAHVNRIQVPDHYYKAWARFNNQDLGLSNPQTILDLFKKLLPQFTDRYLTMAGNEVVVKEMMFNEWQMVAREFSPATMKAFIIHKYHGGDLDALKSCIDSCYKATALPTINNVFFTELTANSGFYDDHIHAGSCLEADIVWIMMLKDAKYFLREYEKGIPHFTYSYAQGICKNLGRVYSICKYGKRQMRKLSEVVGVNTFETPSLASEALMVILALRKIDKGDEKVAILLHKYLLSKGIVRNFLIVQQGQYGLEQFNQTLHAPYRGASFDYIEEALRQMAGNDSKGVEHVELRINPNQMKQLGKLLAAAKQLRDDNGNLFTQVSIVVHVTKGMQRGAYYHRCLRKDLKKIVKDISPYLSTLSKTKIAGIDVTGRDYLATPDVFTDFIQSLRRKKADLHFTYHAGEDFFHILDGLRTIFEIVQFLDYGANDRIGHASAAGVAPSLWVDNLGGTVPMPQGMYLDDLIFACYFIESRQIASLTGVVDKVKTKIQELAQNVYGGENTYENLKDAWLLRKESPEDIVHKSQKDEKESLYFKYLKERTKYERIIAVDCYEFFKEGNLVILQKEIMKLLSEKEITIETMPTSNVTIGHHHSFRSYHLARWMRWKEESNIPNIVMGTDETGVFPTNIKNEYANVYDLLVQNNGLSDDEKEKAKRFVNSIFDKSREKAFCAPIT